MKKKYDIILVNFYFTTTNDFGSTRHYDFINYLAKKYKILIITSKNHHLSRNTRNPINTTFDVIKIDNPKYNNNISRLFSIMYFCLRLFFDHRYLFKNSKFIIATSPDLIAASFTIFISKLYNIKRFLEVRDVWPLTLLIQKDISKINPIYFLLSFLERYIYKNSNQIFSNLKFFNLRLNELKIQKKFIYLPDLINFKKINEDKGKINLIYCGSENKSNNFNIIYNFIKKIGKKLNNISIYIFIYNSKNNKYKSNGNVKIQQNKSVKYIEKFITKKKINYGLSSISYSELYHYGCSPRKFNLYEKFSISNINLCLKKNKKHDFWKYSYNFNYLNFNSQLKSLVKFFNSKKVKKKYLSSYNLVIKKKLDNFVK